MITRYYPVSISAFDMKFSINDSAGAPNPLVTWNSIFLDRLCLKLCIVLSNQQAKVDNVIRNYHLNQVHGITASPVQEPTCS